MLAQFADIGMKFVKQDEKSRKEVFLERATDVIGKSFKWLRDEQIIDDFGGENENTVLDLDNFFTVFLQVNVKNQSIAINALKEGLTLDGEYNIFLCLRLTDILIPNFFQTGTVDTQLTLNACINFIILCIGEAFRGTCS